MKNSNFRALGLLLAAIIYCSLANAGMARAADTHDFQGFSARAHCYHHYEREPLRHHRGYWASQDGMPVWVDVG